jgi:hypothetical protein
MMHLRKWLAGTALTVTLMGATAGVSVAQEASGSAAADEAAFGQCVSGMASEPEHGGIGLHYMTMHPDSEQSVGAHLQGMRLGDCHHMEHAE